MVLSFFFVQTAYFSRSFQVMPGPVRDLQRRPFQRLEIYTGHTPFLSPTNSVICYSAKGLQQLTNKALTTYLHYSIDALPLHVPACNEGLLWCTVAILARCQLLSGQFSDICTTDHMVQKLIYIMHH